VSVTDTLERYQGDPVAFCREVLKFEPWSAQRQILESVRDHGRTTVRSCHGAGKTAIAARCALWFLAVHPNSRVITTAPTWQQVKGLLWREIHVAYHAAGGLIGGEIFDTRLELGPEWVAFGLSTDRPERFQGHHAPDILTIFDEASGVEEGIYEAASGFLTTPGARVLMIGNPTRTSGEFFASFNSSRGFYNPIAIPASSTPAFTGERVPPEVARKLVSREWVETHRLKWGEHSPLYQVRVEAKFPSQSDDVVVALADLEEAQQRTVEPGQPLIVSADVARFGNDTTVIGVRRGNHFRVARAYGGKDLMSTVGEILTVARELHAEHGRKPTLILDDSGLGGGAVDRLQEVGEFRTIAYVGARSPKQPREYVNARGEDHFMLAEILSTLDLDPADEDLAADLLASRYSLDSAARRVVESKAEVKKRLRRSPDRADCVIMAYSVERPGRWGRLRRPAKIMVATGQITDAAPRRPVRGRRPVRDASAGGVIMNPNAAGVVAHDAFSELYGYLRGRR
jgi:hypothetical protein